MSDTDLYMRYIGVLSLLGNVAAHLPTNSEWHDSIEVAMEDAARNHPIAWRRTLNRYDIEPTS